MNNKKNGFTLIELIVTISVLVILALVATPSISNLLAKQKLNMTTRDLVSTFNEARNQAVLLHKNTEVILHSTLENTSTNFYWDKESGTSLIAPKMIPSLIFQENGTLKNIDGNAFVTTDFIICSLQINSKRTITLTRMGDVSVETGGEC